MLSRTFRFTIAAAAALVAIACADSTGPGSGADAIATVEVLAGQRALALGDTVILQARARSERGAVLPGYTPTWQSSDTAVVTVSSTGRAIAVGTGTAILKAIMEGKSAGVELSVTIPTVATVSIEPGVLTLPLFGGQQMIVTARDSGGRELHGRTVTWSSLDPEVVEVDAFGRVIARGVGTTAVRAVIEGRSAEVAVTVRPAEVASITVGPAPVVVEVGLMRILIAIVLDSAGNRLPGAPVTWGVDNPAVATVSAQGMVAGVGPGYAMVTASSGGRSFSVAVTVTPNDPDPMSHDLVYHLTTPAALGRLVIAGTAAHTGATVLPIGMTARQPAPSPTGHRIAFYGSSEGTDDAPRIDDIYVVNRDGSGLQRLTSEPGFDGDPAWSPDGARIAWRRLDPGSGRSAIWVMNADGTGKQELTADMAESHSIGAPAWSRDGARIAFSAMSVAGSPRIAGIWTMAADGSDKRQHTSTTSGFDNAPTWSPSGLQIAFIRTYEDDTDITIVTLASGETRRVFLPGRQWSPAWSPDGQHFAYWQPVGTTGASAIYSARISGGSVRLHTEAAAGAAYDPEWISR